jgi:hypothetical protein
VLVVGPPDQQRSCDLDVVLQQRIEDIHARQGIDRLPQSLNKFERESAQSPRG